VLVVVCCLVVVVCCLVVVCGFTTGYVAQSIQQLTLRKLIPQSMNRSIKSMVHVNGIHICYGCIIHCPCIIIGLPCFTKIPITDRSIWDGPTLRIYTYVYIYIHGQIITQAGTDDFQNHYTTESPESRQGVCC
jgi:hypothetical protein